MSLPNALRRRALQIPTTTVAGQDVIENLGVLIEVRPDRPDIPMFTEDLRRGECHPIQVHYNAPDDQLFDGVTFINRHEKHIFLTNDDWTAIVMDWALSGVIPKDGRVPTTAFRDARKGIYKYRSFRYLLMQRYRQWVVNP